MGSVYNRGTRAKPNWWGKFKERDGRWKSVPTKQPTKEQAKNWVKEVEARIRRGQVGVEGAREEPVCGSLMKTWSEGLRNRNARDDRSRLKNHLMPVFGAKRPSEITIASVLEWLDAQKRAGKLSDASMRHNLNLLSRFFGWAIERGHASFNPVRQIPVGRRPHQAAKTDVPWIDDDALVRKLIAELPSPVNMMFYLGNRSGLRTGEICGLRVSDLSFLGEGVIRVRFSYEGPLKEDKGGKGKAKFVPAATDTAAVIGRWLVQRQAEGAGPEHLVFPRKSGKPGCWSDTLVSRAWRETAERVEPTQKLTWYQATRHSFVSRNLAHGESLDEVSAAVGHSSPVVTRRYYDHFVRRTFSPGLREGLGLTPSAGDAVILPIKVVRRPVKSAKAKSATA